MENGMFSKNYLKSKYFIDFPLCYENDDFKVGIDLHLISEYSDYTVYY